MQVAFSTYPNDDLVRPEHKAPENTTQPVREIKKATSEIKVKSFEPQPLEKFPTQGNVSLKFKQDPDTGRLVVEMIDDKTGDSLRQMPTEASLRFSKIIGKIQAKFLDKQV